MFLVLYRPDALNMSHFPKPCFFNWVNKTSTVTKYLQLYLGAFSIELANLWLQNTEQAS